MLFRSVFSRKSGPGKSTLSCSMAAYLNNHWKKVCIVDADPQCSSKRWSERRAEGFIEEDAIKVFSMTGDIEGELEKLKKLDYDHIIVDCAGRDSVEMRSALCIADLAIMVTLPSYLDREHYSYIADLLKDFKKENPRLKIKSVISLVTSEDANEVKKTRKDLKKHSLRPLGATIKAKVDYKKVMEHGLGGTESDISAVANGMTSVIEEILG